MKKVLMSLMVGFLCLPMMASARSLTEIDQVKGDKNFDFVFSPDQKGGSLTLKQDTALDIVVNEGEELAILLNGHKLTSENATSSVIEIKKGGRVNIVDDTKKGVIEKW